ncbi:bifunctional phosphopantothenoylcysteine decarboxylase/phosphopantothenate--cysteine ligase CoaBC [Granulicella tundricola]|uniref:Coenzyme A biosynthesis bifunctional protein CoaBC n=1 Tax=Granulicella tundricola (strain ATCC BAA-1859 / DSM 23138 / MP5ACTX9) TaxID=1198114 RepID=E8WV62_GRATM|nr:bifunctional phosphopantothenoylcysteine decarboxylase/phosphopantothenate--cysteine ligase CoaBC [Granulicella tundricola]ADW67237.1 phosphopantothenoylcysteine decarboxylase/phosphopantothenate/cysteine ligase [Granulicella tundricola MP5ACTX9]
MKILLGVSGGIAAYKAAELVRTLQQAGVDVQVAMTASAERFITPLTFAALTGHPVLTSLWQPTDAPSESFEIEHISAVQHIDAFVIAPATANLMAKFAHGLADDFLTTAYLANTAPVLLAPAMNVNMWNHPATRANLRTLKERGTTIVEPVAGYLACGMTGSGRLASVETIATEVLNLLHPRHDLAGETILITAGGTREPLDPVRFLGNRSSGKMGHALAESAAARGAKVILVTASPLPAPQSATLIRVDTAHEMQSAVLAQLPQATIVIAAAAVADFRLREVALNKLRRNGPLTIELEPTEDIVAHVVANRRPGTLVIAFAAETESLEENARAKLQRKGADAIVANDVSLPGLGFDSDSNAGLFLTGTQTISLEPASKQVFAGRILDHAIALRAQTVFRTEKELSRT